MDRQDVLAVLQWLQLGLSSADISIFDTLAYSTVRIGLFASGGVEEGTKAAFLAGLPDRLAGGPVCDSYAYYSGTPNTLWVYTKGWTAKSNDSTRPQNDKVALEFSDQLTPDEGLYLIGAFEFGFPLPGEVVTPCAGADSSE